MNDSGIVAGQDQHADWIVFTNVLWGVVFY